MQIPESESVASKSCLRSTALFTRYFRWWIILCLAGLTAMLVVWNKSHPAYAIRFKSTKGNVLATGTMELNASLPWSGEVKLRYQLKFNQAFKDQVEAKWLYEILGNAQNGDAVCWVESKQSGQRRTVINFMPDVYDGGLSATVDDLGAGKLAGTWDCYVHKRGGSNNGPVELEKVK